MSDIRDEIGGGGGGPVEFDDLLNTPTTLDGYGILDAEPALLSPGTSGYILESDSSGNRSWVPKPDSGLDGEDGTSASNVLIQYSASAVVPGDFEETYQAGDIYMRTSTDGGSIWDTPNRILGETGPAGGYTEHIFQNNTNTPSPNPPSGNDPTNSDTGPWYKSPPSGIGHLWMSVGNKDKDDILQGLWSTVVRLNGTETLIQYSIDGSTAWHSTFVTGDIYMRQSIDDGNTWSDAIQVVGETGLGGPFIDYIFRRNTTLPATPTGDDPTIGQGWYDAPPTGTTKLWMTTAKKNNDGTLFAAEVWSTPVIMSAEILLIEYSVDGSTAWHSTFQSGTDIYMRQSADGGNAWSDAAQMVGETGIQGDYTSFIFIRSANQPTTPTAEDPTDSQGWYDAPPTGTTKLWMSKALFVNDLLSGVWSEPAQIEGDDGASGSNAKTIQLTSDAQLFGYDNSSGSPVLQTASSINFSVNRQNISGGTTWSAVDSLGGVVSDRLTSTTDTTAILTEANFQTITNNSSVIVTATADAIADTITIIELFSGQDGSPGQDGDGADGVSALLTNETHTVAAASDGTGYSLLAAGGTLKLYEGLTEVTADATFSIFGTSSSNGLTISVSNAGGTEGVYSLSGGTWTSDTETFTIRGIYNTIIVDKVYTISKSKAGLTGSKGDKGDIGDTGLTGPDGSAGVSGDDGVSIIWQGTFTSHPGSPSNGWAYYNSTDGKSYVRQDGAWYQMTIDGPAGQNGSDGAEGLSIVWKGDLPSPPSSPVENWSYRDTSNEQVYIYTGVAWEVMVVDGSDGPQGTTGSAGSDGLSVFITYHNNSIDTEPNNPTGNGTTSGWHTAPAATDNWMSQKVATDASSGSWGNPIRITGDTGSTGTQGIQGIQGEPGDTGNTGAAGATGVSTRLDIAYGTGSDGGSADHPTGTLSGTYTPADATGKAWIGSNMVVWNANATEPAVSTTNTDYEWTQMTGDTGSTGSTGAAGTDGDDGSSGLASRVDFAYSDSDNGVGNLQLPSGTFEGANYTSAAPVGTNMYIGTNVITWIASNSEPVPTTTLSDYEWSKFIGDKGDKGNTGDTGPQGNPGADGVDGDPGANGAAGNTNAQLTIYRRSSSVLSVAPTGGSFNFTTNTITAPSSWYSTIPAGTDPIYISVVIATIAGTSGIDSSLPWGSPDLLVQNGDTGPTGSTGPTGTSGLSTAQVSVYRRATSTPSKPADNSASYNFGSNLLTPPSGWSASVPAGTDPIYVTDATFSVIGTSGTDSTQAWSNPILFVQNGDDGAKGDTGNTGSTGTSGTSTYMIHVYTRSAGTPTKPTNGTGSFNFGTNTLVEPTPSAWDEDVPAADGNPLWLSTALASITGDTGIDSSLTWTSATKMVEDGVDGVDGDDGATGSTGDRGAGRFEVGTSTGVWSDSTAHAACTGGTAVANDVVTIYKTTDPTIQTTKFWNGSIWGVFALHLHGSVLVDGTLAADAIVANSITGNHMGVNSLSAIAADMGTVTGGTFRTAATGSRCVMSGSDSEILKIYDTDNNPTFWVNIDGDLFFNGTLTSGIIDDMRLFSNTILGALNPSLVNEASTTGGNSILSNVTHTATTGYQEYILPEYVISGNSNDPSISFAFEDGGETGLATGPGAPNYTITLYRSTNGNVGSPSWSLVTTNDSSGWKENGSATLSNSFIGTQTSIPSSFIKFWNDEEDEWVYIATGESTYGYSINKTITFTDSVANDVKCHYKLRIDWVAGGQNTPGLTSFAVSELTATTSYNLTVATSAPVQGTDTPHANGHMWYVY